MEVSSRIKVQNVDRFYLRYQQYHLLQDTLIGKKNNIFKYIDFLSCYLQRYIGVKRIEKSKIKSGAQWFSLNQELIEYILDHEKWINEQFKNTYCPDEAFIQTLIRNTKFMDTLFDNGNSNLRFVDFY
ncbi:beta-1,6-N-acetylglucosaminyltransferase [Pediococcus ethanolidurans]|uniref:beta-1,6-N-acetylglucosaminyltransferase n=1 Tax=Pediococcus ethanolidurans TaxID=319653 RepID=UPI0021E74F3F|nr:beta-1,6-N-acetylglucosaminyltransferase [Pediococcus ethanolidurans]